MREGLMAKLILKSLVLVLLPCMAASTVLAVEDTYYIGPGDALEISVWRDESLTRQIVVPPDGVISFPLIGDIDVTRMTVRDIRNEIKKKLSEYVPDATVTVIILGFDSLKAYVIGKVNNPGEFPITMETDVMQMLSKAGGLNPFAAAGKIHILRRTQGKNVKIPFDYKEVLKGENLEQNIILQRGDVVVVP
jgi:polysaccharide export outer membrane protein